MKTHFKTHLNALQIACNQFQLGSSDVKTKLLGECSKNKRFTLKQFLTYHNCLLFLMAYPEDKDLLRLTKLEINRFYALIKKLSRYQINALERSGLPFTSTQGIYSFMLLRWLYKIFADEIEIYSIEEGGIHPREILKNSFSDMEFELLSADYLSPLKWLEKACGSKNKKELLQFLYLELDTLNVKNHVKDQLFDALKVFISLRSTSVDLSRAALCLPLKKYYFQSEGLLKKFDEQLLIHSKLPVAKKLLREEKEEIIRISRLTLFLLSRETDPVTLCDESGLEYYDLERGLSIALFSKVAERRMPLESYIGFMMFKNGLPMAYGGAWIFAQKALLGINIFESYRGGESAFVFSQLLRTYKQRFKISHFEVEPYQFGKNNPEGLKSGAFWFYYRFGFKPLDKELRSLSELELKKIQAQKNYRTSISTLRKFTNSNLFLSYDNNAFLLDASSISHFISDEITRKFKGNRQDAKTFCLNNLCLELGIDMKKLDHEAKIGLEKLWAFVGFCIDFTRASARDKKAIKDFIFEKGKSEFLYTEMSRKLDFKTLIVKELR